MKGGGARDHFRRQAFLAFPIPHLWETPKEARVKKIPEKKLEFDFTNLAIPRKDMLSGGIPKNKIPALVNPKMLSASEDTYINDDDEVWDAPL